ncbi:MAG: DUF5110 domain-containing protein [Acidobacteriaceae bacterium]
MYVRGGAILPIAPLTQNTAETPKGPLTLRVYPPTGQNTEQCGGEVYSDDGHTFAFRQGTYARIHFSCAAASDGSMSVTIGKQEGSWKPWWKAYRVEVVGWQPKQRHATVDGRTVSLAELGGRWGITLPASAGETKIELH